MQLRVTHREKVAVCKNSLEDSICTLRILAQAKLVEEHFLEAECHGFFVLILFKDWLIAMYHCVRTHTSVLDDPKHVHVMALVVLVQEPTQGKQTSYDALTVLKLARFNSEFDTTGKL